MAGHQTSNKRPPQRLVRSLAGFCTTRFPDSGERERSAKTSIHRDQPVGFAGLKTRLHAAETDTNPKCKRGRHSHPRLRFGLVCSGRKCVSFGRAEYRKRNPRSWSRLNGVSHNPLRKTACRSGTPAASMTWTRQHGSPDTSGICNRESRTPPPCEHRGFGRRPVERADDDRGGCAAPRSSESAFSHQPGPARISRAGLFSCAASSKVQQRSRSPAFLKAGLLFVGRCSNKKSG